MTCLMRHVSEGGVIVKAAHSFLLFSSLFFQAKNTLIDFRDQTAFPPKKMAENHGAGFAAPPAILEGPPPEPEWAISITQIANPLSGAAFEVRLTNLSTNEHFVPIAIDGRKVGKKCPDGTILEANLGLVSEEDATQSIGNFVTYGCQALPETLTSLQAGDSVTFKGVYPGVRVAQRSKAVHAWFFLAKNKYKAAGDGWIETKSADVLIRSKDRDLE